MTSLKLEPQQWRIYDQTIDYCLARKTDPHCKLQVSTYIVAVATVCSLLKAAAMFGTLCFHPEQTLVTVGDAISSWLDNPDPATTNRCLLGAKFIVCERDAYVAAGLGLHDCGFHPPVPFQSGKGGRWGRTVKRTTLITLPILSIITLFATWVLFNEAYMSSDDTIGATGFGAFLPSALLDFQEGFTSFILYVLLANTPQLVFSCLYFLYNGLVTSMCLAHEYSSYSIRRRPLRVTIPRGEQRSTHWLNLPYMFGVPILAISATLHWTISQSIFFVGIEVYQKDQPEPSHKLVGLAFSFLPIICDIVLGSCMLLALYGLALRRLHSNMPIAGSNSLAISGACHRPEGDTDAATKPIMWGEVETIPADSEVGHCTFTSMEVTTPINRKLYAGSRSRRYFRPEDNTMVEQKA